MDKKIKDEPVSYNLLPLVSIITVCYNSENFIIDTIESVINQTYTKYEYIIIDGGSTDSTLEKIQNYKKHIANLISEPDKGIYDAMNKGVELSQGEWIIFLNSGDKFYENNILRKIFNKYNYHYDFIYGDCKITYSHELSRIEKARKVEELWKGMVFSHQSLFTNMKVFKMQKFNINNKIAGDFEFIYKCYLKGYKFHHIELIISEILAGGLSDINRISSIVSRWRFIKKNSKGLTRINIYYLSLLLESFFKLLTKNILPKGIYNFFLRQKYNIRQK